jgi:diguanylate cyclase (GGDEF)-like protein
MQFENARRRVLLAAELGAAEPIQQLFKSGPLDTWEAVQADCFAQVRFIMQHHPCDVIVVHEGLVQREGEPALGWIVQNPEIPVVFLSSYRPESITQAYRQGVTVCVPRDLTLSHPWLLDAAMHRAMEIGEDCRSRRRSLDQLQQCRKHIDRLVHLIWRTSPMEPNTQWFTQRHTMERLHEEIARTQRHGGALTLAVAEVRREQGGQAPAVKEGEMELDHVDVLTSKVVSRAKRRCDVAGHYGMQGFLLLMVQTPKQGGVICCKRLKKMLEQAATDSPGPRGPIRAYFGLASSAAKTATAQELLLSAEQNLEAAKAGKGEGVVG